MIKVHNHGINPQKRMSNHEYKEKQSIQGSCELSANPIHKRQYKSLTKYLNCHKNSHLQLKQPYITISQALMIFLNL